MTWKKYFKPVNSVLPSAQRTVDNTSTYSSTAKYSNWLPEVYAGPPDRLQRYTVYDSMNYDHEISAAIDTIADFGTEPDEVTKLPLLIKFNDDPTPSEIQILEKSLSQWCRLNKINRRLWRMFRSVLVYGDQFFLRDPETFKLYWIDPAKVEKVIVNESEGKKIESYFVKDIDLNMKSLVGTNQLNKLSNEAFGASSVVFAPPMSGNTNYVSGSYGATGSSNYQGAGSTAVDAEHIVQLSLTDGMNAAWPFGLSILEQIYKVYKQKELLEDAILIYRIHRAPERRVFFIDVGTMPPNKAQQYLERIRYEVQQKRIPSRTGGGGNVQDSSYNPMCLDMATRVPLLDGRVLTISELADEYNSGKENWVYSQDKEHNLEPGKIVWAGVTRKNAEVCRVHLDNGKYIDATPDHRFIARNGAEIEAKDLISGTSLMPLYLNEAKTSIKQKGKPYLRYIDNNSGKVKWVHTAVCPKTESDTEIHHKDFNSRNNEPTNLVEMSTSAHRQLHKDAGTYSIQKQWNSPVAREKLLQGINACYRNRSAEFENMLSTRNKKNGEKSRNSLANKSHIREEQRKLSLAKTIKYSVGMFTRMTELYNSGYTSISTLREQLINDAQFQQEFTHANFGIIRDKGNLTFKVSGKAFSNLVKSAGYKSWNEFKSSYNYNHKVVKVEMLPYRLDTGDITVESKSNMHIFALESGVFVHNSMLEDYYFAVTSEGRGSKVEVLPGGENLGDIDDLRYFNNKMLRALGVPSSYLPTGPEDGTSSMSDGKVGTAFIQEFRFSKVVARYQQQIIEPIDMEFKLFLKFRGITIDNSLFELEFTPPQSFSEYRQLELDSARINTFTALMDVPYISKRFVLKTYLAWSEEQLAENERMWKEERSRLTKTFAPEQGGGGSGLSDVGITSSGIDDMAPIDDMTPDTGSETPGSAATDAEIDNFGDQ